LVHAPAASAAPAINRTRILVDVMKPSIVERTGRLTQFRRRRILPVSDLIWARHFATAPDDDDRSNFRDGTQDHAVRKGERRPLVARVRTAAAPASRSADWLEWIWRHQPTGPHDLRHQGSRHRVLRQAWVRLPRRARTPGAPQAPGLRRQFPLR